MTAERNATILRQSRADEFLDVGEDLGGVLASNQPTRYLCGSYRRDHRFCARALVATSYAVELQRRSRPELFQR